MSEALHNVNYRNVLKHLGDVFEDYYELKKQGKYIGKCTCGNYIPLDYRHGKCPWCIQAEIIRGAK